MLVVEAAAERTLKITSATGVRAHVGSGVEGTVDGIRVLIGNRSLMQTQAIDFAEATEALERLEAEGKTTVLVSVDGKIAGVLAIRDEIRAESAPGDRVVAHTGYQRGDVEWRRHPCR